MNKSAKTKAFIIERSAPLFNKKGYAGTSMSDLVAATGLTKGAIYGNFENKDEVALEVFEYNVRRLHKRWQEAMSFHRTASAKMIGFVEYYRYNWLGMAERGGCPLLNAAVEADDNLPFLKSKVKRG